MALSNSLLARCVFPQLKKSGGFSRRIPSTAAKGVYSLKVWTIKTSTTKQTTMRTIVATLPRNIGENPLWASAGAEENAISTARMLVEDEGLCNQKKQPSMDL